LDSVASGDWIDYSREAEGGARPDGRVVEVEG